MIKLNQFESNLLFFCKTHYWSDFWAGIEKIYCEEYDMGEFDVVGAYHMVRDLWVKLLAERGDSFLLDYENLSLPNQNWKVWGGLNSTVKCPWNEPDNWSSSDVVKAKIAAMASQLKLSDMKYWEYLPPEKTFAGMNLSPNSHFTEK